MKLGVIDYIDCAHYIPGHDKCGSLHGHTYKIEVVIEGEKNESLFCGFALRQANGFLFRLQIKIPKNVQA